MNHHTASSRNQHRRKQPFFLILCIAGLLVNYLLAHLATSLKLPLYLDNIGSALAAALGGYIPGIIVGFFTNLINGIGDYTTAYYGSYWPTDVTYKLHPAFVPGYLPSRIPGHPRA